MNRAAILYICIGEYIKFFEGFYKSFEEHFLNNSHIEYFAFTDSEKMPIEVDHERVHLIEQKDFGWPGNTLYRYRMFLCIEKELRDFDYCFFFNSKMMHAV